MFKFSCHRKRFSDYSFFTMEMPFSSFQGGGKGRSHLWLSVILVSSLLAGLVRASDRGLVEKVLSEPWYHTAKEFSQTGSKRALRTLLNAPISGFSGKSHLNLLTFSVKNNFIALAKWGVENGADVNRADGQGSTLLLSAVASKKPELLDFALQQECDVNLQAGVNQDTVLAALMRWKWSAASIGKALDNGARPRNEGERQLLLDYVAKVQNNKNLVKKIERAGLLLAWEQRNAVAANSLDIDMLERMDRALQQSIINGVLAGEPLSNFGRDRGDFERFLEVNGFEKALKARMSSLPVELARE